MNNTDYNLKIKRESDLTTKLTKEEVQLKKDLLNSSRLSNSLENFQRNNYYGSFISDKR